MSAWFLDSELSTCSYSNDSGSKMRQMFPSQNIINVKLLIFLWIILLVYNYTNRLTAVVVIKPSYNVSVHAINC